ncbi:MAG: hypothetical protein GY833_12090 [Aestuariibacter sp.]|nr:hypothetical protein [Aestuariibacter sp.]|tara:strand:+ start:10322 stop:10891 length:570 start_codon:yes stop_codon:yes gene_type:complete
MSTDDSVSLIEQLEALRDKNTVYEAPVKSILKRLEGALQRGKITLKGFSDDGEPQYADPSTASHRDQLRFGLMVENEIKSGRVIALNNHQGRGQGESKGQRLARLEDELAVMTIVLPIKIGAEKLEGIITAYIDDLIVNNPELSESQVIAKTLKYLRATMFGRYDNREAREIVEVTAGANLNSCLVTAW